MGYRLAERSPGGGGNGSVSVAGAGVAMLLAAAAFLMVCGTPVRAEAAQPEEVAVGRFSVGDLAGWKVREFKGRTRYEIGDDPEGGGGPVLAASSRGAASALYQEREIDLAVTPILSWRWRVESPLPIADERRKGGDDFAARVYVVSEGHGLLGLPLGITYVWANAPAGEAWPNPFTARAVMVVVDSGPGGEWRRHERDVREDFRRYHGKDVETLDGVALMTDTDNSGTEGRAWYGDLSFRARRTEAGGADRGDGS